MAIKTIENLSGLDPDMKIDAGDYLFEIINARFDVFERSGRDCLVLEGEFVDGPTQSSGIEIPGRKQTFKLGMPKADDKATTRNMFGGRIKKLCLAAGHEVETGAIDDSFFSGKIVGVKIKHRDEFIEANNFFDSNEFEAGGDAPVTGSSASSLY